MLFLQPDRAGFVHGDVDHVRPEILPRLRSRRQVTLMFSVWLICKLIIMNDASKKNMMSISGMMTIRVRRFGTGEKIFIANTNQWLVVWLGAAGWCK